MSAHGREHDHLDAAGRAPSAEMEPPEPDPVERVASGIGNRAFTELARARARGSSPTAGPTPTSRRRSRRRAAAAAPSTRASASGSGPGLGDDLGDVRVHDGPDADALARSVQARAFAVGQRRLLRRAASTAPAPPRATALIAHELTHVVQQRGAPATGR